MPKISFCITVHKRTPTHLPLHVHGLHLPTHLYICTKSLRAFNSKGKKHRNPLRKSESRARRVGGAGQRLNRRDIQSRGVAVIVSSDQKKDNRVHASRLPVAIKEKINKKERSHQRVRATRGRRPEISKGEGEEGVLRLSSELSS